MAATLPSPAWQGGHAGDRRCRPVPGSPSRCTSTARPAGRVRTGSRRPRSSASMPRASSRRSSPDVDGALTVARRARRRRSSTSRALGKRARMADAKLGRAGDRVRRGRDQPARPAQAAADGPRRVGARLRHDPRQRRPARARDRARARRPGPAHRGARGADRPPLGSRPVSDQVPVELHIVSDSTGETAARLVLALEAQFPEQAFDGDPAPARRVGRRPRSSPSHRPAAVRP